jgi:hypothetical protein
MALPFHKTVIDALAKPESVERRVIILDLRRRFHLDTVAKFPIKATLAFLTLATSQNRGFAATAMSGLGAHSG